MAESESTKYTASIKITPETHRRLKVQSAEFDISMQTIADDGITLELAIIQAERRGNNSIRQTISDLLGLHRNQPQEVKLHEPEAAQKLPRRRIAG